MSLFLQDVPTIVHWWAILFFIGLGFLPLSHVLFPKFFDKGYMFAKILGICILTYVFFLLGVLHVISFSNFPSLGFFLLLLLIGCTLFLSTKKTYYKHLQASWKIYLLEELLFFAAILFWSLIRGFSPDIHGLEKYMDFGFINSILRASSFPPKDMWFPPFSINYYYFGHISTALLARMSALPSFITFNLMIATIFAFCASASFSIGANMYFLAKKKDKYRYFLTILSGLVTSFFVTFAGNLQTIYAFFRPYSNEDPKPFWQLPFSPSTFPNSYWYPNATRFIYHTIHEFPLYSFVVSDLHGHVLDIPFVLLMLAIFLSFLFEKRNDTTVIALPKLLLLGFLLACMYMTNVWDSFIYFLLTIFLLLYKSKKEHTYFFESSRILPFAISILVVLVSFFVFTIPYSLYFKSFVSSVGVLCAPEFLTAKGKLGPFLFEPNHCQKSPLWQLFVLYGFFYFWVFVFLAQILKRKLITVEVYISFLIGLSTLLIILPEFIYAKDIYPAHYRANTMFKLTYQSFIMLSLVCGYVISTSVTTIRSSLKKRWYLFPLFLIGICLSALVAIYPFFAIPSYYGNFTVYHSLNGISYLKNLYPNDYQAIMWLQKNIKGQPVTLEAQGDSYTDYERVSANTGLPTVLGWTVHEWLWRGTYDIPAPRIAEVQKMYESNDLLETKQLLTKYHVSFVFIGDLERQKYPTIDEEKFKQLGKLMYQNGQTKIYKLSFL